MDPTKEFAEEVAANIRRLMASESMHARSLEWMRSITELRYAYNFSWLGRPIIQIPQDVFALQELIWSIRPDLVIETGIAHGGSLIMSASMLALLDYADAVNSGTVLDPTKTRRRVLGVDIDIRKHNRAAIEAHPMSHRIDMIQGSSVSPDVVGKVKEIAKGHQTILVILDSNHTHEHVLAELDAYAPLVTKGSYCVVFDTIVEDLPGISFPGRGWGPGDNPKTAVWEFLKSLESSDRRGADGEPLKFSIDKEMQAKLLLTVAPDGYLKRG